MANLAELEASVEDFSKPKTIVSLAESTKESMRKAHELLCKYSANPLSLLACASGTKELTRSGMKRLVEFVEVQEGDKTLVIEVYTK